MNEFELKFQVGTAQRAAVEAAVARGKSYRKRLRARYFDTADGALAAQRIVLRLRKEDATWVQTAKAPTKDPLSRLEHNVELPAMGAREQPVPLAGRHDGSPVGDLIAKALRKAGHDPATVELVPLYGTDVWRTTREMRTGDALVELAFDHGEVSAGERSHPICELEIELKHGSPASLLELAQRWRNRYGLWLDTVSKAERGERVAKGIEFAPPVKASPPEIEDDPSGPAVFRAVLQACLAQMLPNASEVAAGSTDGEHVHQLRVGIRRLRTGLREMADLSPGIDPSWEPALAASFRALGLQRDRDHLLQAVQPQVEAAGGPPVTWPDGAGDLPQPAEIVRGAAFQTVLMALVTASSSPPDSTGADAPPTPSARKRLTLHLAKLHRQVVRDGKRFEQLEPEAQHRVRKRLKRLRYLGEFVAPLFGERKARRYLEGLEPAQDALGDHNDHAVALAAYREASTHDARAWFAVGWLSARQPASATACRVALETIAEARPFWKPAKS